MRLLPHKSVNVSGTDEQLWLRLEVEMPIKFTTAYELLLFPSALHIDEWESTVTNVAALPDALLFTSQWPLSSLISCVDLYYDTHQDVSIAFGAVQPDTRVQCYMYPTGG